MHGYNFVAIIPDESICVMKEAMTDKLSVVQNVFWFNTQEKKPKGKYSIMQKWLTISLIMQFADESIRTLFFIGSSSSEPVKTLKVLSHGLQRCSERHTQPLRIHKKGTHI